MRFGLDLLEQLLVVRQAVGHRLFGGEQRLVAEVAASFGDGEIVVQVQPFHRTGFQHRLGQAEPEVQPLPGEHDVAHHPAGDPQFGPALAARLHDRASELEHVDRFAVVDEVRLAGCRSARHQVLGGQDETVNQVVHVGVVQLGAFVADQHLDVTGDHAFEQLAEHGLVPVAPDARGPDRAGQHAVHAVLAQHELLGDHLGLGVEVVELGGVRHGLIAARDGLAAHHHTVGSGVDEALHPGPLPGLDQVLGAVDIDREAAPTDLVGDFRAALQVDDRGSVEHGVDVGDCRGYGLRVADVAFQLLQVGVVGQRRRRSVEGPHLIAALQQRLDEIGADEAGAAGDQYPAEFSSQCRITHRASITERVSVLVGEVTRGHRHRVRRPAPPARGGGRRPGALRTAWPAARRAPRGSGRRPDPARPAPALQSALTYKADP